MFLGRIIKSNEQRKHLTEVHELECGRVRFDLKYEPDLAWLHSILAPLRWPQWSLRKHIEAVRGCVKSPDYGLGKSWAQRFRKDLGAGRLGRGFVSFGFRHSLDHSISKL